MSPSVPVAGPQTICQSLFRTACTWYADEIWNPVSWTTVRDKCSSISAEVSYIREGPVWLDGRGSGVVPPPSSKGDPMLSSQVGKAQAPFERKANAQAAAWN